VVGLLQSGVFHAPVLRPLCEPVFVSVVLKCDEKRSRKIWISNILTFIQRIDFAALRFRRTTTDSILRASTELWVRAHTMTAYDI
jgi:hypothetical protein